VAGNTEVASILEMTAMNIREAISQDNEDLQHLQARCPQGTTLVVTTVNTPDFFGRAKASEFYKVYVACEGNRIIGSVACSVRNALVNARVHRVGHGFQLFVDPEYRRKGISSLLYQTCEDYLRDQGAVLSFGLIMEGNIASARHFEAQDFKPHRTLTMAGLIPFKEMKIPDGGKLRYLLPGDRDEVATLLNETWQGYNLYEPVSPDSLHNLIMRTPAYEYENITVLEQDGRIAACLGYWDWSRVTRVTMESLNFKMRITALLSNIVRRFAPLLPPAPRPGDILKQAVVTHIGFKDPGDAVLLLRNLNNRALHDGIGTIFLVCESNHALLKQIKGFFRMDTDMHLYIKIHKPEISLNNNPAYVSGFEW
jgi:GNAT superfamily N-acetyltransferase